MQITSWFKMKGKKGTVLHIGAKVLLNWHFNFNLIFDSDEKQLELKNNATL